MATLGRRKKRGGKTEEEGFIHLHMEPHGEETVGDKFSQFARAEAFKIPKENLLFEMSMEGVIFIIISMCYIILV